VPASSKTRFGGYGLNLSGLQHKQTAGICQHHNEASSFTGDEECSKYLNEYQLLKRTHLH
jgi:hypothetical protein